MASRYYPGVEVDVSLLTSELRNLCDSDYEVQTMNVSSMTVLQTRKSSTLRYALRRVVEERDQSLLQFVAASTADQKS